MTFRPLDAKQLRRRYGKFYKRRRKFSLSDVPYKFRELIPYAEIWSLGDDGEREELIDNAPYLARMDLLAMLDERERLNALTDWIADPKADKTGAFYAFIDLELAYESLAALRSWEAEQKSQE